MNIDRIVFTVAGLFILVSVGLSQLHSVNWLWFTIFVGTNMLQAAFTGFCSMTMILKALRKKSGCAFR
jgi:hypothetical protein